MNAMRNAANGGPRIGLRRLAALLAAAALLGSNAPAGAQATKPGTKVVEHDLGQKDKSYRVLLPDDAQPARKLPMVVYLHPSGKPNFDDVRRDYALLERPASACTECGACVKRCPFDVRVIEKMRETARLLG